MLVYVLYTYVWKARISYNIVSAAYDNLNYNYYYNFCYKHRVYCKGLIINPVHIVNE